MKTPPVRLQKKLCYSTTTPNEEAAQTSLVKQQQNEPLSTGLLHHTNSPLETHFRTLSAKDYDASQKTASVGYLLHNLLLPAHTYFIRLYGGFKIASLITCIAPPPPESGNERPGPGRSQFPFRFGHCYFPSIVPTISLPPLNVLAFQPSPTSERCGHSTGEQTGRAKLDMRPWHFTQH